MATSSAVTGIKRLEGANEDARDSCRVARPRSAKRIPAGASNRQIVRHPGRHFALRGSFSQQLLFGLIPERVHSSAGLAGGSPEFISAFADIFFAQTRHVSLSL